MKIKLCVILVILVSINIYAQKQSIINLGGHTFYNPDANRFDFKGYRFEYITAGFENMIISNFSAGINLGYLIPKRTLEKIVSNTSIRESKSRFTGILININPVTYNFSSELKGLYVGLDAGMYRFSYESSTVKTSITNNTVITSSSNSNANNVYMGGLRAGYKAWFSSKIGVDISGGILFNVDEPILPFNLKFVYNLKS